MPYCIKDAEGRFRFATDDRPVEDKELAEDYIRRSEEEWKETYPNWYPFDLIEV